jgi:hypothetical protein
MPREVKARCFFLGCFSMSDTYLPERAVLIHTADSFGEAIVIRGLLESAGFRSPGPPSSHLLPVSKTPGGTGKDVYVLESEADEARKLIEEYLRANANEPDSGSEPGEGNR